MQLYFYIPFSLQFDQTPSYKCPHVKQGLLSEFTFILSKLSMFTQGCLITTMEKKGNIYKIAPYDIVYFDR